MKQDFNKILMTSNQNFFSCVLCLICYFYMNIINILLCFWAVPKKMICKELYDDTDFLRFLDAFQTQFAIFSFSKLLCSAIYSQ